MGTKADRLSYSALRRTQSRIVRIQSFNPGELWDIYNSANVKNYAEHLTQKYFHKSKELAIYQDIKRLYCVFLTIAPVLQRQKFAFKIDWHRGHLLSWIRRNANGRVKRFYYQFNELKREVNINTLNLNLVTMGIMDTRFKEELIDLFRYYYSKEGVKGKLANCIFDGIMFLHKGSGYRVRVGNKFYSLEKKPQNNGSWVDLRESYAPIWDYEVRYKSPQKKGEKGKFDIRICQSKLSEFRDSINRIINSSSTPAYKIAICSKRIESFVETAKYAKSALPQVCELRQWLRKKTSMLAGTEKHARQLPDLVVNLWLRNCVKDKFFQNKPNFFWNNDINKPHQHVFDIFFSPYREV